MRSRALSDNQKKNVALHTGQYAREELPGGCRESWALLLLLSNGGLIVENDSHAANRRPFVVQYQPRFCGICLAVEYIRRKTQEKLRRVYCPLVIFRFGYVKLIREKGRVWYSVLDFTVL